MSRPGPDDWGVFVNECGVLAVGGAPATWWVHFWARSCPGRITALVLSVAGGHHHVACDSKEDAEFLHGHMIAQGIAASHVAVRQLSVAKATAAKRKAASDEKLELKRLAWSARNGVSS